jgi:hypothetical protein
MFIVQVKKKLYELYISDLVLFSVAKGRIWIPNNPAIIS